MKPMSTHTVRLFKRCIAKKGRLQIRNAAVRMEIVTDACLNFLSFFFPRVLFFCFTMYIVLIMKLVNTVRDGISSSNIITFFWMSRLQFGAWGEINMLHPVTLQLYSKYQNLKPTKKASTINIPAPYPTSAPITADLLMVWKGATIAIVLVTLIMRTTNMEKKMENLAPIPHVTQVQGEEYTTGCLSLKRETRGETAKQQVQMSVALMTA